MSDLTQVTERLKPLLAEGGMVVVEHPAAAPSQVADGYVLEDTRKYGYVGVSLYALPKEA